MSSSTAAFCDVPPKKTRKVNSGDTGKRDKLWQAMRILKTFTLVELRAASATEEVHSSPNFVRIYCNALLKSGHLKRDRRTYRLIDDTGPKAPQIVYMPQVYDPNLKGGVR